MVLGRGRPESGQLGFLLPYGTTRFVSGRRDIYLPEGKWINLFDGKVTTGNQWIKNFEAALEEMPVWVKYGAKIPVYPEEVCCTDEMDMSKAIMIIFDDSFKGLYKSKIGEVLKK